MLTPTQIQKILSLLPLENESISWEDIECIAFCSDLFSFDGNSLLSRHIDIEFTFGEYLEISEDSPLFQHICALCALPLSQENQEELLLYQKTPS